VTRLPRSLDDLTGLRAARWLRESTRRQGDNFGPDAQRRQQDDAIARYGLIDSGLSWNVQHSGRTIATTDQWRAMMAAAGHGFDVLVVGYVSRFARDLRTAVNARHDLHASGAVLLFADERVLSSDEATWDLWAREAVEAESYSRRLAKRVAEGYEAKFRRHGDQAGPAPLGFTRTGDDATLVLDPERCQIVVGLFRRYASGVVSYEQLGTDHGMEAGAVREILRNPIYNGWVRRHRRSDREQRIPAPWRSDPPVSDALWARVEAVRASRAHSSGPRPQGRPQGILGGLLWCPCGSRVRSNGIRHGETFVIHPQRGCPEWGERRTQAMGWYEDAIGAQVEGIRLDALTLAAVVAAVTSPPTPHIPIDTARQRRTLALEHAGGTITDTAYMAAVERLRREDVPAEPLERFDASEVVERLRALPALWRRSDPAERRALAHAIYERIEVRGREFAGAHLTPDALALGLHHALPRSVGLVSREGDRITRSTVRIPVEGRRRLRTA